MLSQSQFLTLEFFRWVIRLDFDVKITWVSNCDHPCERSCEYNCCQWSLTFRQPERKSYSSVYYLSVENVGPLNVIGQFSHDVIGGFRPVYFDPSIYFFFLLFTVRRHLKSYFKNSCFVFYRGFQTLENNKSSRPNGFEL